MFVCMLRGAYVSGKVQRYGHALEKADGLHGMSCMSKKGRDYAEADAGQFRSRAS